jgi:hypothetical protein
VTDPHDYPRGKADYAFRSVERLRAQASALGEHVGVFVARLVDGPLPWTKMRAAYGLLRLCERYGSARVDTYCERALAFDVLDTRRIEQMLKHAMAIESDGVREGNVARLPLPSARFARDASAFVTRTPTSRSDEGGLQ